MDNIRDLKLDGSGKLSLVELSWFELNVMRTEMVLCTCTVQ